jgi:ribonuclease P protein component
MADQRFRPEHHVRRAADYQRALRRRASASDWWGVVFGHPNGLPHPRLGLSVSKRLGGAVVRNRWKRLLREAFRQIRTELPPGIDLIVIARISTPPPLQALRESLSHLTARVAKRLGCIVPPASDSLPRKASSHTLD